MENRIKIAGIVNETISDGPGLRMTVFAQGCPHGCEGCHNEHTHDYNGGHYVSVNEILEKIDKNPLLDGVTFSGGEPFEQAQAFAGLGGRIKERGLNVITYTGYTFEYLTKNADDLNMFGALLEVTDYLVDGPYEADKKNYLLKFKGSSNQRVIDCAKSLSSGNICEFDFLSLNGS